MALDAPTWSSSQTNANCMIFPSAVTTVNSGASLNKAGYLKQNTSGHPLGVVVTAPVVCTHSRNKMQH